MKGPSFGGKLLVFFTGLILANILVLAIWINSKIGAEQVELGLKLWSAQVFPHAKLTIGPVSSSWGTQLKIEVKDVKLEIPAENKAGTKPLMIPLLSAPSLTLKVGLATLLGRSEKALTIQGEAPSFYFSRDERGRSVWVKAGLQQQNTGGGDPQGKGKLSAVDNYWMNIFQSVSVNAKFTQGKFLFSKQIDPSSRALSFEKMVIRNLYHPRFISLPAYELVFDMSSVEWANRPLEGELLVIGQGDFSKIFRNGQWKSSIVFQWNDGKWNGKDFPLFKSEVKLSGNLFQDLVEGDLGLNWGSLGEGRGNLSWSESSGQIKNLQLNFNVKQLARLLHFQRVSIDEKIELNVNGQFSWGQSDFWPSLNFQLSGPIKIDPFDSSQASLTAEASWKKEELAFQLRGDALQGAIDLSGVIPGQTLIEIKRFLKESASNQRILELSAAAPIELKLSLSRTDLAKLLHPLPPLWHRKKKAHKFQFDSPFDRFKKGFGALPYRLNFKLDQVKMGPRQLSAQGEWYSHREEWVTSLIKVQSGEGTLELVLKGGGQGDGIHCRLKAKLNNFETSLFESLLPTSWPHLEGKASGKVMGSCPYQIIRPNQKVELSIDFNYPSDRPGKWKLEQWDNALVKGLNGMEVGKKWENKEDATWPYQLTFSTFQIDFREGAQSLSLKNVLIKEEGEAGGVIWGDGKLIEDRSSDAKYGQFQGELKWFWPKGLNHDSTLVGKKISTSWKGAEFMLPLILVDSSREKSQKMVKKDKTRDKDSKQKSVQ